MRERASIIHAIQCIEAFAKLFSSTTPTPAPAPMTAERLDQCAWLIECRIGPESTYVQLKSREELSQEWEEEIHARGCDAAKKLKPWHFTKDASSATRFAREEDAARTMVALGMQGPTGPLDWLKPIEHMWPAPEAPDRSALTARVAELEGAALQPQGEKK